MRSSFGLASVVVTFALTPALPFAVPGCGSSPSDAEPHVVVLFTADEHSHFFASSPELDDVPMASAAGSGPLVGGVARRAVVIYRLRKDADAAGKDSLLVSAGDNQMGCLPMLAFESESLDFGTMKTLGYDVTTFGNHEFDFGPKALATSLNAAIAKGGSPPVVASNLHLSDTDPGDDDLAKLVGTGAGDKPVEPYRLVTTKSGVKVGVIGFVGIGAARLAPNKTPVTFSLADPKNDGNLATNLPQLYKDLQPVVDHLRNDLGAQLVIALSHAGIVDASTPEGIAAGEDTGVCQNVNGIDLVVSGHAHQHDAKAMPTTNRTTGRACLVLNGGAFGQEVGTVDFTVHRDPNVPPTWDRATQAMVPVNESVVPDPMLARQADGIVTGVEKITQSGNSLAGLLSHAIGAPVTHDPAKTGDLYFKTLGTTDFDVTEPNALVALSADAMLQQADALVTEIGLPATLVAIESQAVTRSALKKGKTGNIAATDAFNVVPLGASPVDGSKGYPLVRAYITMAELRGVVELSRARGPQNEVYNLGIAGLKVEYDKTRPTISSASDLFDKAKGQVMKMYLDTDHKDGFEQYDKLVYDRATSPAYDDSLVSVITSSYIAQFAGDAGVSIKNSLGKDVTIAGSIVKRKDGTEVKQVEAFMRSIHAAPGGKLPSTYNTASPSYTRRLVCTKGC